jgi:tetratricopeptide (TPR) repeat protein
MQAETIYRQILAVNPKSFDALRLLGVVQAQRKELEPAARTLREAIALEPRHPVAHFNYANVLRDLARSDEAIASYDKALALKPDYLDALNNRGNLLLDLKRFELALAAAIERSAKCDAEFRIFDVHGGVRCFVAKGRVMRDLSGTAIRIVGTMPEIPATVRRGRHKERTPDAEPHPRCGGRVPGL